MLEKGSLETSLVTGPVEYSMLRPGTGPSTELPIVLWLHGGGGSSRFLESCQAQFVSCWGEKSLPDLVAVTPSAGWSFFLDRRDGGELWETFLFDELVPHIRKQTGSTVGPLVLGGISGGALAALRLAFRRPELVTAVAAVEPTIEAAMAAAEVPLRDRAHLPKGLRSRLYGDPIDARYWQANHPPALVEHNHAAIAASGMAIYLEGGDADQLHAQFGVEMLHRRLFDVGISHEYRMVRGGNHVGPTIGPRVVDALRFVGSVLKPVPYDMASINAMVEVETFAEQVRELEFASGYRSQVQVARPDCTLTVHAQGEGPGVIAVPSLGRGHEDYADLADRVARAGYRFLRPEPRGMAGSSATLNGLTLDDFANDIAAVIEATDTDPAVVIGHDFGAQVAQVLASRRPDLVDRLVLLAPPGPIQPKPEPATALRRVFISELSDEEHLEAVALALFADGNDPVVWVGGWYPMLAYAQAEAERHVPIEELWSRLETDTLVVQPSEDLIVLPDNAALFSSAGGDLVDVVEIPGAGHALLPEQPEAVATTVLSWLEGPR